MNLKFIQQLHAIYVVGLSKLTQPQTVQRSQRSPRRWEVQGDGKARKWEGKEAEAKKPKEAKKMRSQKSKENKKAQKQKVQKS